MGFRLRGPLPLGLTELKSHSGLVAIGGLNGAGKSTLLDALSETLTMRLRKVKYAHVLIRFTDSDKPNSYLVERLLDGLDFRDKNCDTATLFEYFAQVAAPTIRLRDPDAFPLDLRRAVAEQHMLALRLNSEPLTGKTKLTWSMAVLPEVSDEHVVNWIARETANQGRHIQPDEPLPKPSESSDFRWWLRGSLPVPFSGLAIPLVRPRADARYFGAEKLQPMQQPGQGTTALFAKLRRTSLTTPAQSRYLLGYEDNFDEMSGEHANEVMQLARDWAEHLSQKATAYWADLRPDQAQELWCSVTADASAWAKGQFFDWRTRDPCADTWYPVDSLSTGLGRWAGLAIAAAIRDRYPDKPSKSQGAATIGKQQQWWLMDEPERGLHRSAERFTATQLARVAEDRGITVITATHSDAVMGAASHLLTVSRSPKGLVVSEVGPLPSDLASLGLDHTDLMGWYRAFLFVEGHHDRIALEGFVGGELQRLRVKIVAMGGATKLPGTIASELFLDITGCAIAGLVDGVSVPEARTIWQQAQHEFDNRGFNAMKSWAEHATKPFGTEGKAIKDFILQSATQLQHRQRFSLLGLPRADVLLYVNPRALSENLPSTWREVYEAEPEKRNSPKKRFEEWAPRKPWLSETYQVDIDSVLGRAVASTARQDGTPKDINLMLAALEAHIEGVDGREGVVDRSGGHWSEPDDRIDPWF